ncbi:MAG: NAD(+)/NADH kinase [Micrococcales bacterium]|nr:NAD(+)/NADH kinase [Micrococcales bacterium]
MGVESWVAVAAAVLALLGVGLGLFLWRRHVRLRRSAFVRPSLERVRSRSGTGLRIALVVNPTKPDLARLRERVVAACADRGLSEPIWLETTPQDPGTGQARQALAVGADLVVAVGGDGTVRAVAEAMAGSYVPMGLIPLGTGNLLARNIDVPLGDPMAAFATALDGHDKAVDVGRLHVDRWGPDGGDEREHLFLVIAGLGFDAAMVADTDSHLKARVGWMAYFVSGIRHLHGKRLKVRVARDGGDPQSAWVRSMLVGNCGRLPGGINLLPDALLDDGWLDLAVIDTRGGLAGWAQLFGEVVLQGVGFRNVLPAKIGRIDHARAQAVHLEVTGSATMQVDGDIVGDVAELTAWAEPGALLLRTG